MATYAAATLLGGLAFMTPYLPPVTGAQTGQPLVSDQAWVCLLVFAFSVPEELRPRRFYLALLLAWFLKVADDVACSKRWSLFAYAYAGFGHMFFGSAIREWMRLPRTLTAMGKVDKTKSEHSGLKTE